MVLNRTTGRSRARRSSRARGSPLILTAWPGRQLHTHRPGAHSPTESCLAVALAALARAGTPKVLQDWLNPTGPAPVSPVLCAVLARRDLAQHHRPERGLRSRSSVDHQQSASHRHRARWPEAFAQRAGVDGVDGAAGSDCVYFRGRGRQPSRSDVCSGSLQPLRLLLAAGTSVCGCTAICAMTPVVRARAVESGLAVTLCRGARLHRHARLSVACARRIRRCHECGRGFPRHVDSRHVTGDGRVDDLRAAVQRRGRRAHRGLHQAAA